MTKYTIEDGFSLLDVPPPNKGGRPPLEHLAERDKKILEELAQGAALDEVINANLPNHIVKEKTEKPDVYHHRKKDLKKRISDLIRNSQKD